MSGSAPSPSTTSSRRVAQGAIIMLIAQANQSWDVTIRALLAGHSASITKILLPIELPIFDFAAIQQTASMARHFGATILALHVLPPLQFPAVVRRAQSDLEQMVRSELRGIRADHLLLRGDPASEIVRMATEEKVDLIVMPAQRYQVRGSAFFGSATSKVLHRSPCPVWVGIAAKGDAKQGFKVRNVLCALDLTQHSHRTLSGAAQMAAAFGANLTLVHVTTSVEMFGPGGFYIHQGFRNAVV